MLKHVLRRNVSEPQESDEGYSRRAASNEMPVSDQEEDRAMMEMSPSATSAPNRRIRDSKSDLVISDDDDSNATRLHSAAFDLCNLSHATEGRR